MNVLNLAMSCKRRFWIQKVGYVKVLWKQFWPSMKMTIIEELICALSYGQTLAKFGEVDVQARELPGTAIIMSAIKLNGLKNHFAFVTLIFSPNYSRYIET